MNKDVSQYFDAVPESRKPHIDALHAAIMECFPQATVDMKYKMPTYNYADGWVAIANQKNYVSLYTCSAEHLAAFKKNHPDSQTGKGCIKVREKDAIPVDAVKGVIRHAIQRPKGA